jgi:hypothetical protein
MDRDGSTAPPGDFPSRESLRVSRPAFKKLIDTPALTKMTVQLAKNEEMKIHTAARIAARYTSGACPSSIARRLVKHFPVAVSEFYITNEEGNVGDQLVDDEISLSQNDRLILINILGLIEHAIEEDFLPLVQLSPFAFKMVFNNLEILLSHVRTFRLAIGILRVIDPVVYRKIMFKMS